ncbi:MAG: hypothetical protein JHC98_01870 [Thermoleophilaceae bacterium]|nr:hypothetical protein [Thermoleophilaceae bacterium]
MRFFARPIVISLAVLLLLTSALTAFANDSDAPPGANERWLPCENWVMYHWLPFREDHFYKLTGINRRDLKTHLYENDTNTIAELVVKHKKDPNAIVERLMNRWVGKVSDRQFTELTRRSNALMTQSHLSQHVFFHLFHDPAIGLKAKWIFNISPGDYHHARMTGWSPREIARHGGVPVKRAVRRAMSVLRQEQENGIKRQQTTRAAARIFLHRQQAWTHKWLYQDIHIYKKRKFPHGQMDMTGTRAQKSCEMMTGAGHERGAHDDT